MVTISNYHLRQNKEGKQFVTLELQGDLEMVQSAETGHFYATVRRCSITSTVTESIAKTLIGTKMPGKIIRMSCAQYDYLVPETGEVISLQHTYQYTPDETTNDTVHSSQPVMMGA